MSASVPHPPIERLLLFLTDPSSGPEGEELRSHLEQCPDCQQAIEQEQRNRAQELLAGAWDGPQPLADPVEGDRPRRLGSFRIVALVGEGATGLVYQATDVELQRPVAIKQLRSTWAATVTGRARFVAEARAAASLQHPNLVTVHQVINDPATPPYLVMEFVPGESLAARSQRCGTLLPLEAARIVRDAARGLACIHSAGMVHRDVKPGNILLSGEGTVKVADFGLARAVAAAGLSLERSPRCPLLGTPPYLSPEQIAKPDQVDARSDVYSLGVILYELLTGSPPFPGAGEEWREQVTTGEPMPPRRLRPGIPEDLETIVLACLAREPAFRYPSATELAGDLDRFVQGTSLEIRRPSWSVRLRGWCVPHPVLAAAALVMVLALGAAVCGVGWLATRYGQDEQRLAQTRQELERVRGQHQAATAEQALDLGLNLCEQGEVGGGLLWLARALERAPPHADELTQSIRLQIAAWGREIHPLRECLEHPGPVYSVAFAPGGQRLLTGCEDRGLRVWSLAENRLLVTLPHRRSVTGVAVSPDGRTLLGRVKGVVEFWDIDEKDSPEYVERKKTPEGELFHQTIFGNEAEGLFSLDGRGVLAVSKDLTAQLWDAQGRKLGPGWKVPARVLALALSPDGHTLLTSHTDNFVRSWDAGTGQMRYQLEHDTEVTALAFSPRGDRVLSASKDHTARLWDPTTGQPIGSPLRHIDKVYSACFRSDGLVILTASKDHTVRLWDAATGRPLGAPCWHEGPAFQAVFHPDGRTIITASDDHTVRVWQVADTAPRLVSVTLERPATTAAFRPDGGAVLVASQTGPGGLWPTDGQARPLWTYPNVAAAAFRPDGQVVAVAHHGGTVHLLAAGTGTPLPLLLPHLPIGRSLAFHPDGRLLLTGGDDGDRMVRLWDTTTGNLRWVSPPLSGSVTATAFSPDGKAFLTGCWDGSVQVWETAPAKPLGEPLVHRGAITAVAYRPDGRVFLSASRDATGQLWDARTRRPVGRPLRHDQAITSAAFSPDGRLVATGSEDGTARLWDALTGHPLALPLPHPDRVQVVAFHPNGRHLLVAGHRETIQLWDLPLVNQEPPFRITSWLEVETGLSLGQDGRLQSLTREEWQQRRQTLKGPTQPGN